MANTKDGGNNVVKIAILPSDDLHPVKPENAGAVQNDIATQFIVFHQKRPLTAIIEELCVSWKIMDPGQHALKFSDDGKTGPQVVVKLRRDVTDKLPYVNEKNRNDVKNGSVLCLTYSAAKTAQDILVVLKAPIGTADDKRDALCRLSNLATDATFVQEFINNQGLVLVISDIENNSLTGNALGYALASFILLMELGNVFWDVLEPKFVAKISNFVNSPSATTDLRILKSSLAILECLVVNSGDRYEMVDKEVSMASLIKHLQSEQADVQQNAIALINALFLKADAPKRVCMAATLSSRIVRNVILNNIVQHPNKHGAEMAHQLYVLQTLQLNLLEEKMSTELDPQDQEAMAKIVELRRKAFDADDTGGKDVAARRQGGFAKDYRRLGFTNHANPAEDFRAMTPPGVLALDCMLHFAMHHKDKYAKVVLENSCRVDEHECPFGSTAIQLTKLLCEILKIGEHPTDQGEVYYPMFFLQDHPFEEFFCVCIMLLNKTWKEMRATKQDFIKVFSVVREQIIRALACESSSMESFRTKLNSLTYNEITKIWQQERQYREEWVCQAKPIVDLREHIKPEIMLLIKEQRLNHLVEGTTFTKYSAKGQRIKDKFWYCRLAPNHKVFHYGDCHEGAAPSLEQLPNKIPVVDIRSLVMGKDCPHMKDGKVKKTAAPLAFSVLLDSEQGSLDFVAHNEQMRDYWIDGISALIGQAMTSKETNSDLEALLSMDIKLRLLDTEGVKIPEIPPLIPDEPPNYDFYYDFK